MTQGFSHPTFERIAELVTGRIGVVATRTAAADLERAVREVMTQLGMRSLDELANRLAAGALWHELIDRFTVRETYFFRSPEHFELVRTKVVPALARERPDSHHLRVWSAGCASGEEAYSIAVALHQCGVLEDASVLGTDVSQDALSRARDARYREWSFRAVDPALLNVYFRQEHSERVVCDFIREHVRFADSNLLEDEADAPTGTRGQFDLIFCRNVLIYFDAPTIARVERRLFDALAPGGWLIAGPSDPPLGTTTPLEVVVYGRGVCYRRRALHELRPPPAKPVRLPPLPPALPKRDDIAPPRRSAPPAPDRTPPLALASAAFERAEYARVLELARRHQGEPRLAALAIRAVWNQSGVSAAECACAEALSSHPLCSELHYLHAMTLMEGKRLAEALRAVRHVLYLDRTLTIAHFAHATILERLHDLEGARRAYRNTFDACAKHQPDHALPLGDGIVAQGLANAATHALQELSKRCPA